MGMPEQSFNPDAARLQFGEINDLVDVVAEQNGRFGQADALGDEEFRALASEGIAAEQNETLAQIAPRVADAPYELVAVESLKVERALGNVAGLLAAARPQIEEKQAAIDAMAAEAIRVSPGSRDRINELAVRRKQAIEHELLGASREHVEALEQMRGEVDAMFQLAGRPWPVPRVLGGADMQQSPAAEAPQDTPQPVGPTETGSTVMRVTMPVEPVHSERNSPSFKTLREHHVHAPEASILIALKLADKVGEVVNVEELIEAVYPGSASTEAELRSRITTLLGPQVHGRRIQRMLNESDLVLQYGWEQEVREEHGEFVPVNASTARRVYRVVHQADVAGATVKEQFVRGSAGFTFEPVPQDIINELPNSVQAEAAAVSVEKTPPREVPDAAGYTAVRTSVEIASDTDAPDLNITPVVPVKKRTPAERRGDWLKQFQQQVGRAIQELEDDGLMSEGMQTVQNIRLRTSKGVLGTNTAVDRLEAAGIISATRNLGAETRLEASELIVMSLQNSYDHILGPNGKRTERRKQALVVIESALEVYFAKRRETE